MQAEIYDKVRAETNGVKYEGTLMPSQTDRIVLKLKNGYNIGINKESVSLTLLEKKEEKKIPPETVCIEKNKKDKLPNISILSTGGTIASKIDYRTGAVTSQFSADDILRAIPELEEIANYNCRMIYSILSENMRPSYWVELARAVYEEIKNGANGRHYHTWYGYHDVYGRSSLVHDRNPCPYCACGLPAKRGQAKQR